MPILHQDVHNCQLRLGKIFSMCLDRKFTLMAINYIRLDAFSLSLSLSLSLIKILGEIRWWAVGNGLVTDLDRNRFTSRKGKTLLGNR